MEVVASFAQGALIGGRYRIRRRLAGGGMSTLVEVVDERTDRVRALKLLQPALAESDAHRRRFEREAKLSARIASAHVIDILDAGVDEASGSPYLVMPCLVGRDLAAEIEAEGTLAPGVLLGYLAQIAAGLDAAHAASIVHRDLKPANVFVSTRDDGSAHLTVLDFGIAKLLDRVATQPTESILGSPLYLAPEQVRFRKEPVSGAADVYALGQLTYAALVGEPYFAKEDEEADGVMGLLMEMALGATEAASVRALARRDVRLPPGFDAWFAKATARDAEDRFASASAAVRDLAAALDEALPEIPRARSDPSAPRVAEERPRPARTSATPSPKNGIPRDESPAAAPSRRGWIVALALIGVAAALFFATRGRGSMPDVRDDEVAARPTLVPTPSPTSAADPGPVPTSAADPGPVPTSAADPGSPQPARIDAREPAAPETPSAGQQGSVSAPVAPPSPRPARPAATPTPSVRTSAAAPVWQPPVVER
jgi:serine/threonine protein kinase